MAFPARTRMTAQHVDTLMQQRRRDEGQMAGLLAFNAASSLQNAANAREMTITTMRRKNEVASYAAENMFEDRARTVRVMLRYIFNF